MVFRVYLRDDKQRVARDSKTTTPDPAAALVAFRALIERTDLDGQRVAAALTQDGRQLAFHRFDAPAGSPDNWRGRLHELSP